MIVTIVFYKLPMPSGNTEEGVEAFLSRDEAAVFVKEILRERGSSVETLQTTKEEILKIGRPSSDA